jgi:hypothetical protein
VVLARLGRWRSIWRRALLDEELVLPRALEEKELSGDDPRAAASQRGVDLRRRPRRRVRPVPGLNFKIRNSCLPTGSPSVGEVLNAW